MSVTRHNIGDHLIITEENMKNMQNANLFRVNTGWLSDDFLKKIEPVFKNKIEGVVTHTFLPGYEITANFGDYGSFHMKDHYVTNLTLQLEEQNRITKTELKDWHFKQAAAHQEALIDAELVNNKTLVAFHKVMHKMHNNDYEKLKSRLPEADPQKWQKPQGYDHNKPWHYEVSAHGYTIKFNDNPVFGVSTRGTNTHTEDGKRKHYKTIAADLKMYKEQAVRICLDKNKKWHQYGCKKQSCKLQGISL